MKRDTWPAILVLMALAFAAWGAVTIFGGCVTTEDGTEPDWAAISRELELGAADLRDIALFVQDEPTAAALVELADVLDLAASGTAEGGTTLEMVERALKLADQLIEKLPEGAQDDARLAVVIVRAGLRRAQAYAR